MVCMFRQCLSIMVLQQEMQMLLMLHLEQTDALDEPSAEAGKRCTALRKDLATTPAWCLF